MSQTAKKVVFYAVLFLITVAFFLLLQAKHDRDYNAKYNPAVLMGMTPDAVRHKLGEPSVITESGAWVYDEKGGDAVIRFEAGHVAHLKRDQQHGE